MKVLITSPGGAGHVNQLVPLAQTMAAREHEVRWAVPDRAAADIEQAGLHSVGIPCPPPPSPAELMDRFPELRGLTPPEIPDRMFAKLFGATYAPQMLEGLAPFALDWRPDLIVFDIAELAAPIVGAELGVPAVSKAFGSMIPLHRLQRAEAEVAPLWESRGLEPRPYCGVYDHLYLDVYPPELQSPEISQVPHRQLLRLDTYSGPVDQSASLPLPTGKPDAPLVYVTMGTVFNNPDLFAGLVAAVADLDVRVLVTVGAQGDPAAVGSFPDHVRVERYVPQSAVLPHCAVVVSHAGSGTALAALELGIPQLCLPQGADQYLNAAAIAKAGAGLSLPAGTDPGEISDAVRRLLADTSYREAAAGIGASIRAMPAPEEVAGVLEALVT
jgi:UDP:flavonoid glycosyltransferase YjiC (YdhE family)